MSAVQYSLYHVPEAEFWKARVHKESGTLQREPSTTRLARSPPRGAVAPASSSLAYWQSGSMTTSTMDPQELFARARKAQRAKSPAARLKAANRVPGTHPAHLAPAPSPAPRR
eukprot:tig00001029_g6435.t1